jgi:hypothetical protein
LVIDRVHRKECEVVRLIESREWCGRRCDVNEGRTGGDSPGIQKHDVK